MGLEILLESGDDIPELEGLPKDSVYTRKRARIALLGMVEGKTLWRTCKEARQTDPDFPASHTIRLWAKRNYDGFAVAYAEAKELQAEMWSDDCVEIADDSSRDWKDGERGRTVDNEVVSRSKLRIETRRWLMSANHPSAFAGSTTQRMGLLGATDEIPSLLIVGVAPIQTQPSGDNEDDV